MIHRTILVLMACAGLAMAQPVNQAQLTFQAGPDVARVYTPSRLITGGAAFVVQGASGMIDLAGTKVLCAGRFDEQTKYVGLDLDGNGRIDGNEWQPAPDNGSADFSLRTGEREIAIVLGELRVALVAGTVTAVTGKVLPAGCWQGQIDGVAVQVFDDNQDGRLEQGGADAIAIGGSTWAIPFGQLHQLGGNHYRLELQPDGASIGFTRVDQPALGLVRLSFDPLPLKSLAVLGEHGESYDLVVSGPTGIPAGTYRLVCGALSDEKDIVAIAPTGPNVAPTVTVQAGQTTAMKAGPPLELGFNPRLSGKQIVIPPIFKVLGAGGEQYLLHLAGTKMTAPKVTLAEGDRQLSQASMAYG